jgi:2-haloalkanoic acid dehalogenase type II
VQGLADSIEFWPAFTDSRDALSGLQKHFKLAVVSNIDDDLLAHSQAVLGTEFDYVVTAQKVGCYKPDSRMFEAALEQVEGPVLHIAQSRYHDVVPAAKLGLDTVWIDRPSRGAAKPCDADPTWTFTSMAEFAAAIGV